MSNINLPVLCTDTMLVLCAIAVVEWLGINEITLITGAFALAFGSYLVSPSFSSFKLKSP